MLSNKLSNKPSHFSCGAGIELFAQGNKLISFQLIDPDNQLTVFLFQLFNQTLSLWYQMNNSSLSGLTIILESAVFPLRIQLPTLE